MTKTCIKCKQIKDLSEFWNNVKAKDGLQSKCKPCHSLGIDKDLARNNKLLKNYGITLDQYKELSAGVDDKCTICDQPEFIVDKRTGKVRALAVDHDPANGVVRGLLCSKHNRGIGMFDDDIELLNRAIQYLQAYQEALKEHNAINQI